MTKLLSQEKLIAAGATFIGRKAGISFYEHPTRGDESPLIAFIGQGKAIITDFWEMPDSSDANDFAATVNVEV